MHAASGYDEALAALCRARVDFIVVGVAGINFYARSPDEAVATLDVDLLLRPQVLVLKSALAVLRQFRFTFEAGGELFVDLDDHGVLAGLVRSGATVRASHPDGASIDLMLSIASGTYAGLARGARWFTVAGKRLRPKT